MSHYTYVENRPIILTDPTGWISESDADAAEKIVNRLQRNYNVRIVVDWGYRSVPLPYTFPNLDVHQICVWNEGNWRELRELSLTEIAVLRTSIKLGGPAKFKSAMGGVVNISRWNWPPVRSFAPPTVIPFLGDIILTNYHFDVKSYGDEFVQHTVIHELAHVWDWREGRRLSTGMAKDIGTLVCDTHPIYGEVCSFDITRIMELPPGKLIDNYAGKNAMEDWAESFATFIYPDYYRKKALRLLVPGGLREAYIQTQINSIP